jgi:hypothetical protein
MAMDKSERLELVEASNRARHQGALERLEKQNEFRSQLTEASQEIALRTAKIEGEYALRLRELEIEYAPQEKALDFRFFALRHELMLEEIEEREIISAIYRVMENLVAHNLKASEERDRAKQETALAKLKERHRENERQHEIARVRLDMDRDAMQSRLRNDEFSHSQTVSRIEIPLKMREVGLLDRSAASPSEDDAAAWIERLKSRGTL